MKVYFVCAAVLAVFLLGFVPAAPADNIIFVDGNRPGDDGTNWARAYRYLQDALAEADLVIGPTQVIVAGGVYRPDRSAAVPGGSGDHNASFVLPAEVVLYGGYAGFGESDPNSRDIDSNVTVLSGDLGGDDGAGFAGNGDNSYHVVTSDAVEMAAGLDGFVITGGNAADAVTDHYGAGLYNDQSDLFIANCVIRGNSAGMAAGDYGGGVYNGSGDIVLTNCVFSGNRSFMGGGLYNSNGVISIDNCTFVGNKTDPSGTGGGLYNDNGTAMLANNIFWNNVGDVAGDETDQLNIAGGIAAVDYNCIQGWSGTLGGIGNIGIDPLFVDPGYWDGDNWVEGDYHLRSIGWYWNASRYGYWDYDDDGATSPCIDAGNPGSLLAEELLIIPGYPGNPYGENVRINMGVHGGTSRASMAPHRWRLLADMTNDATVNPADFVLQLQDWLIEDDRRPGDLNRNGTVDLPDFALLAADWLQDGLCVPPEVEIISPQNGMEFEEYIVISIEADASDANGTVVKVTFYVDGVWLADDNDGGDGWTAEWSNHPMSSYDLTARATDDTGLIVTSATVQVTIGGGP